MSREDIIEIDAEKLIRMQKLHVAFHLFDVRSKTEFDQGHIPNAFHLDGAEFVKKITEQIQKKDTPIVIYDNDGVGGADLVVEAEKLGFLNVVNLEGGYRGFVSYSSSSQR